MVVYTAFSASVVGGIWGSVAVPDLLVLVAVVLLAAVLGTLAALRSAATTRWPSRSAARPRACPRACRCPGRPLGLTSRSGPRPRRLNSPGSSSAEWSGDGFRPW
ncbi:hypothetical protein [Asanoa iriomotensis]|uniref:hypothetical protein n=1 Tax=Asanoa iriomotensis TaxID=234613 RepID=UPI003570DA2E